MAILTCNAGTMLLVVGQQGTCVEIEIAGGGEEGVREGVREVVDCTRFKYRTTQNLIAQLTEIVFHISLVNYTLHVASYLSGKLSITSSKQAWRLSYFFRTMATARQFKTQAIVQGKRIWA